MASRRTRWSGAVLAGLAILPLYEVKAIQYAVAGPVIRAIPEVVKAPPGILLPPVFAPFTHRM